MGYSIEEEDRVMQLFESIASQPIVEQRPYNEVRVAKPIVESTACFEGTKVDLNKWSTDSKKVGKAKTASNPDLTKGNNNTDEIIKSTKASSKQETENDTVTEKKEKGKVTKVVVEDNTEESKKAPKPKSGNFDAAAKSAEKASQAKAESNKKFSEESKNQRKAEVLKGFMRSLAVDKKTKDAAEAVCTRIDKHFNIKKKPQTESANLVESTVQATQQATNFFKVLAAKLQGALNNLVGPNYKVDLVPAQFISVSVPNQTQKLYMIMYPQPVNVGTPQRTYGEIKVRENRNGQLNDFSIPVQTLDNNDLIKVINEIIKRCKNGNQVNG